MLNRKRDYTLVAVLHDLNQAARYADHIIAMKDGEVVATGDPATVITEELVRTVFGVDSKIIADPESGAPLMIPTWSHQVSSSNR